MPKKVANVVKKEKGSQNTKTMFVTDMFVTDIQSNENVRIQLRIRNLDN